MSAAASDDRRLAGLAALVTGAGGGLGRAYALALAAQGCAVVVNDRGGAVDGRGADAGPAAAVAAEIEAAGGRALADGSDVGDWGAVGALVARAAEAFGALDVVVHNAGILRPRTLVAMSEDEMASVLRVNVMGAAACAHWAGARWRERFKATGEGGGRLITTTSGSGLFGHGQANYAAAKAGVAALTLVAADEFARFGATANAVCPIAVTRMGAGIAPESFTVEHVAALVAWLAGPSSAAVTGQVLQVGGGHVSVVEGASLGPFEDRPGGWTPADLDARVPALVAAAAPRADVMGHRTGRPRSPLLPDMTLPDMSLPPRTPA